MKPFPSHHSLTKRPSAVTRPIARPVTASPMRSTVLQSLLLSPDGGVEAHRHGQGAPRPRVR
jgi:hypothetical protein